MKKFALFFVFISFSYMSYSQLYLGGQFAYNSTWLMNKQVFDEGAELDIAASFGNYYGIVGGYYFSDDFGLEFNCNFNKIEQKYTGSIKYILTEERNAHNSSIVMNTIDFPVLMKFGKKSYFELGPVIMLVNKATYTRTFEDETILLGWYNNMSYPFSNKVNEGVKSKFNGSGFGVALGFGANMDLIEDVLKFNFGLRFNYIFTDMQGINGLGYDKTELVYMTDAERVNFKTFPLYGGLKVGLTYYFD